MLGRPSPFRPAANISILVKTSNTDLEVAFRRLQIVIAKVLIADDVLMAQQHVIPYLLTHFSNQHIVNFLPLAPLKTQRA